MYKFLDNINNTEDLKNLNIEDLPELCTEIRDFLVKKVSKTGFFVPHFVIPLHSGQTDLYIGYNKSLFYPSTADDCPFR